MRRQSVTTVVVAIALAAPAGCGSQGAAQAGAARAGTGRARVGGAPNGGVPGAGIPSALIRQARPIGRGPRFHPPARGAMVGPCRRGLGRRFGVHVELFAADRVVLLAAGIGTQPPLEFSAGRISHARCYGDLVTIEPTGVVLVRAWARRRLSDLFRAWGEPLSSRQLVSFRAPAGSQVVAFVDGRRWRGSVTRIPLVRHSEIVVEVGPRVPPHSSYTFPLGT